MTYVLVPGKNCGGYSPCMRYWYVEFDFLPSRPPYAHGCNCQVIDIDETQLPHGRTMTECAFVELMTPAEWETLFGRVRARLLLDKQISVTDLIGPRGQPVPDLAVLGFCQSGKRLTPEQHAMALSDSAARGTQHFISAHEEVTEDDLSSGWGVALDEKPAPT